MLYTQNLSQDHETKEQGRYFYIPGTNITVNEQNSLISIIEDHCGLKPVPGKEENRES